MWGGESLSLRDLAGARPEGFRCAGSAGLRYPWTLAAGPVQICIIPLNHLRKDIFASLTSSYESKLPTRMPEKQKPRFGEADSMEYFPICGGKGIRTPGTGNRTPVFEAGSFNHSDIPPFFDTKIWKFVKKTYICQDKK